MIHAIPKEIELESETEEIVIRCFADIHFGLKASDAERFQHDLRERPGKRTYFIDLGDSLDSIGGVAHKYFNPRNLKEEILLGPKPPLQMERDMLIDIIKANTDKDEWLGHLSGNHPLFLLPNGLDLMQDVCSQLEHTYLGYQAYVPIQFNLGTKRFTFMIFASHGFGGGNQRWEGSGMNAYIQHAMRYEGWDVALYGHRHDKWIKEIVRISPRSVSGKRWVKEEIKIIAQCGTYLKTLSKDVYPTYSEKAGMTPRPLGCVDIRFRITRTEGLEKSLGVLFL